MSRPTSLLIALLSAFMPVPIQAEIATSRLQAEFLTAHAVDASSLSRAEEFLELTDRRLWTYNNKRGDWKQEYWRFENQLTHGGRLWVRFSGHYPIPREVLSAEDRERIDLILKLERAIHRDYRDTQRAIQRNHQMQQLEAQRRQVRRAVVKRSTTVSVSVGGGERTVRVPAGASFDVLAETRSRYKIEVGGREAWIERSYVSLIPANNVDRQAYGSSPAHETTTSPASPPDFGMVVDYVWVSDREVHVELTNVVIDSPSHRVGLRRGDMIRRVNGRQITSPDDFLAEILNSPTLRCTVWRPSRDELRLVTISADSARREPSIRIGVRGRTDRRGEFVVDFVESGDSLGRRLGLARGDRVLAVNNQRIRDETDLARAIRTATGAVRVAVLARGRDDYDERMIDLESLTGSMHVNHNE